MQRTIFNPVDFFTIQRAKSTKNTAVANNKALGLSKVAMNKCGAAMRPVKPLEAAAVCHKRMAKKAKYTALMAFMRVGNCGHCAIICAMP